MRWSILFFMLVLARPTQTPMQSRFWIFNVGQGLWTLLETATSCTHIDAGGERFPSKVKELCKDKRNYFWVTHTDKDHVRWIPWLSRVFGAKLGAPSSSIEKIFAGCPGSTNASSRIFTIEKKILVPGDSPAKCEKIWGEYVPLSINILILGHHGSKTANSEFLLNHLPNLKLAIASSRFQRYKHPSPTVVSRLRKRGIPVLQTEIWGNIKIDLD